MQVLSLFSRLLILLVALGFVIPGHAQRNHLSHKIRTLGIGFHTNIGYGWPLPIEEVEGGLLIEPAYPIFATLPTELQDFEGNYLDDPRLTYTLGGHVSYKHSLANRFLVTFEGGYSRSQVAYYLVNLEPFEDASLAFDSWQDWLNYDQLYGGFYLGFPVGRKRGRFLNLGAKYARANVTETLFKGDVRSYQGITEDNGIRDWSDPSSPRYFGFFDKFSYDVTRIVPRIGYLSQFGKYDSHAFEFAIIYNYSLGGEMINTQYATTGDGFNFEVNEIRYTGNHIAIEASYTMPILRSKRSASFSKPKPPKYQPPINNPPVNNPPVYTQPSPSQPSSDPFFNPIMDDLDNCFNIKSVADVRYEENHFQYTDGTVEFEIYHKDGKEDGDMVTVCVEGNRVLKNHKLTDAGHRFSVPTNGKSLINILIYTENTGALGKNSLGISLISGGKIHTIELDADGKKYYWFKMEPQ